MNKAEIVEIITLLWALLIIMQGIVNDRLSKIKEKIK